MSAKRRLATNTLVNFVALGLNAIIQLAQVAVLTSVWSLERYGAWILLSTIPAYFALTDLGFSAAAQSDMTMSLARGDLARARATYQSTWALMVLVSATVIFLTGAAVWLMNGHANSSNAVVSAIATQGWTAFLFVVYALVSLCARVVLAGFRAANLYATGTLIYEVSLFLECWIMLGVAVAGGSFDDCVLAGIVSRVFWTIVKNVVLARQQPELQLGFAAASRAELRRILKPALAAMATPISLALNLQGIVVVIGYAVSPVAVAIFTPVRTLSRVGLQLAGTFNRATMPEVSRAASLDNSVTLRRLLVATAASALLVLLPGAVLFAVVGQSAVELWTHHRISPPWLVVALLGADMFVQGCWYFISNLLLSTNEHTRVALMTLVISLLSVVAAIPAGIHFGLTGVALTIVGGDLATLLAVLLTFRGSSIFRGAFRHAVQA